MHLAVVTNYAPDGRANGEYGWHLVDGLRAARPQARVSVLAGRPGPAGVERPWRYDSVWLAHDIVRAVQELKADAVLVNTSFNSWGHRLANLAGFWAIHRLAQRLPTVALVHYLPQTLSVGTVGYRLTPLDWLGIEAACRLLRSAHTVAFTLERDRCYFAERYRHARVLQMEHGLLGEARAWSPPEAPAHVLAFGYWGPGKNLEALLRVAARQGELRLVIAGGSHPRFPGFLEHLRSRYPLPNIEWLGYVAEERVDDVFEKASLVVLPYQGDTGTSGVLHLACQHGRAVLAANVPVLRHEAGRLGLAVDFFATEDELAARLACVQESERLARAGRANQEAVSHLAPRAVAQSWWRELEGVRRA